MIFFAESDSFEVANLEFFPDLCRSHRDGQNDQIDLPVWADAGGQSDPTHLVNMTSSYNKDTETTYSETTLPLPKDDEEEDQNLISKKMVGIWNELKPEEYPPVKLTKSRIKKLVKSYSESFNSDLNEWESYCKKLFENDFLTGKKGQGWRANLDWALKEENIAKVLEDYYWYESPAGVLQELGSTKIDEEAFREELKTHCAQEKFDPSWYPISLELISRKSVLSYKTWLMKLNSVSIEDSTLRITADSRFFADTIEREFSHDLKQAAKSIDPRIESVVIDFKKEAK